MGRLSRNELKKRTSANKLSNRKMKKMGIDKEKREKIKQKAAKRLEKRDNKVNEEKDFDNDSYLSDAEKMSDEIENVQVDPDRVHDENEAVLSAAPAVECEFSDSSLEETIIVPEEKEKAEDEKKEEASNLIIVKNRIQKHLTVLQDYSTFKKRIIEKNGKHTIVFSKSQYMENLKKDLMFYYGYNEYLIGKIAEFFPLTDLIDFLEANEKQRPLTIRANSLKIKRKELAEILIAKGVNLDPITWSKVGLIVYQTGGLPIGATPEYLGGLYMLQGASSFMPVIALAPKPNEHVLDMCAAPGGKSTYIATLMNNTGVLVANDVNKDRISALSANIQRMGIINCLVTCMDGREVNKTGVRYQRVLLDAPCSGTGIVSRDGSVKTSKSEQDIQNCSHLQRQLILAAVDALNVGGYLVYSTCSILVEENESVVDYVLKKRSVKLVETGIGLGDGGFVKFRQHRFSQQMKLCRRFYPHLHDMDGFFVAKLKKVSNEVKS